MTTVSLLEIKNRDLNKFIDNVKNVRITHFSSPSSFYVQIIEEDESYSTLQADISKFYGAISSTHFYCGKTKSMRLQEIENPFLKKLKADDLQVSI